MGVFSDKLQRDMSLSEYLENLELEGLDSETIRRIRETMTLAKDMPMPMYQDRFDKSGNLFLYTLIEQNWLIINKLDSIDKNLKELNNK